MSVTVKDVAREAGISRTTVSNVFGGKSKYSDETRDAVLAAAKKLGYKPNLAARSLITNKSGLVGLILPSYLDTTTLTNSPFYNIIMDGVYSVLRDEAYYDLIIFSIPYKENHQEKLRQVSHWMDARNVDGILAIGEYDQPFLRDLSAKDIPVVLIDNYSAENYPNFSYINSDDETGGYLATTQLIKQGYKKISMCSASLHSLLMQKRYAGYKRALAEAGYTEHVFGGGIDAFETGKQLGPNLIREQIDAAFCTEDMLAVGLLQYMLRQRVRVGQEFGLIGFDNINIGAQVYPELSTIDQNIFAKGETAAKTLLGILNGTQSTRLLLPVTLISRETA